MPSGDTGFGLAYFFTLMIAVMVFALLAKSPPTMSAASSLGTFALATSLASPASSLMRLHTGFGALAAADAGTAPRPATVHAMDRAATRRMGGPSGVRNGSS